MLHGLGEIVVDGVDGVDGKGSVLHVKKMKHLINKVK